MTQKQKHWTRLLFLLGFILVLSWWSVNNTRAQMGETRRPIDLIIVIDNSCSMFPADLATSRCQVAGNGNDPGFLRIIGSDIFFASLGFAESNESEYQVGVVNLGEPSRVISPLQPLVPVRGSLARAIANPAPEFSTGIVPALELAYQELRTSPNRRATNQPAVVLITDGLPYPRDGQSDADIERLVSENSDIPLFIMLLQETGSPDLDAYVNFWQGMQSRYPSKVFAYLIENEEQINETYNEIIAQLQSTIPSEPRWVVPNKPLPVFVDKYVQRFIVKVIHLQGQPKGTVKITDPQGNEVLPGEAGVHHFLDPDNPVQVFSIGPGRLDRDENGDGIPDLKDDVWNIESDAQVMVMLDWFGAYRIKFLEPVVSSTDITDVYVAVDSHSPSHELVIRFNLLDTSGMPVTLPQPIQGKVIHPDGSRANLRVPSDIEPDGSGVYEVRYDFKASSYPGPLDELVGFGFIFEAGSGNARDDQATQRRPIAAARLLVDVGPGAYIEKVSPVPLTCASGQPAVLTVTVGDYDISDPDRVHVTVSNSDDQTVNLDLGDPGIFSGDIASLCAPLLAGLTCSTQDDATLTVHLAVQSLDGTSISSEQEIPMQGIAPTCPPTPTDTPVPPTDTPVPPPDTPVPPTPVPTPTPIPDTDGDGGNDLVDKCVDRAGPEWLDWCPVPLWMWIVLALLGLGLLAFIVLWLWPWLKVRTLAKPPRGHVLVCQAGERRAVPKSVYTLGMAKKTNKITIGSDRKKAHIYVKGLKPVEFTVERQGDKTVLSAVQGGVPKIFSDKTPTVIRTSDTNVTLRIGMDQSKLRC